ncbi:hypothetical protein QBC41DRAFT_338300 [Cercophora samala]|uniref:Uncharacterized protein n=1 Tax=Cercophora samala TaxID=330535 RepID=A0AA40D918_9PEZI|nr:hypothetical protein QBC41DRAFT_338300 [Cercophora samala]
MCPPTTNTAAIPAANPQNHQATAPSDGATLPASSYTTVSNVSPPGSGQQQQQSAQPPAEPTTAPATTQNPNPPQPTRKPTGRWPKRTHAAEHDHPTTPLRVEDEVFASLGRAYALIQDANAIRQDAEPASLGRAVALLTLASAEVTNATLRLAVENSIVAVGNTTARLAEGNRLREFDEIMGADDGEDGGFVEDTGSSDVDSDEEERKDFWA